ncbi:MAG: Uma2 family endonuclease [Bacteroidota bacterium]
MGKDRPQQKSYTIPEYQSFLRDSEERYEYANGQLRAMAGGSPAHNNIKADTYGYLYSHLPKTCLPFDSDTAIYLAAHNRFVYPDISFLCGEEPDYLAGGLAQLRNPMLIIEVLSPGTEEYDRGEKFRYYRGLTSFREYVLIHSEKYSVECWYREESDLWRIRSAYQRDQSIFLETLQLEVPLEAIYKRVEL